MDVKSGAVQTQGQGLGCNFRSGPGSNEKRIDAFNPSIDGTTRRTRKWTAVEDSKLKDTVHMHSDNDWVAVVALVPGRTKRYMGKGRRHQTEGCGTNVLCVPVASDLLLGRDEKLEFCMNVKKHKAAYML
jgi:hypothetical protein